ncbi:MAG TPA: MerR family transcriptional regulator [Rubrobacter sp.]|nr:MerR family transcriptional regulator [Rubrobacter sp.]
MSIGEAARLVGVTTKKTIRHYEKVRLLGAPQRSEAGYRLYAAADDLLRLQRVRRLQSLGLSLGRIKAVSASPAPTLGCWRCWRRCSWRSRDSSRPPEERPERIRETLDREDPELPEGSLGPEVGEGVPGRLP